MNILYISADSGIPVRGHKGAAVHIRAMCDAFAALGHHVTLVTPRPDGEFVDWGEKDGRVKIVSADVMWNNAAAGREKLAQDVADRTLEKARELAATNMFDFVYERYSLWSDLGLRLSGKFALPFVLEVNAPLRAEAARYRSLGDEGTAAEIERRMLAAAQIITVPSLPLVKYVVNAGAHPDRVLLVPNAVDEKYFHPGYDPYTIRVELGLTSKFVVGFVGTVKPWHDLEALMQAVAILQEKAPEKEFHLLLVGDIPTATRERLNHYGLREVTTIVGPIAHDQVAEHISAMDVAVSPHPAIDDFYFAPLKLNEYMACAVPTIAADLPSISQGDGGDGRALLYPPGDAGTLAERIMELASDQSLRKGIGWRGAEYVLTNHTWKGNAQKVVESIVPYANAGPVPTSLPSFDVRLGAYLYRATRADLAGPLLDAALRSVGEPGVERIETLTLLKYRPGRRAVFDYQIVKEKESRAIIGKVYRGERGSDQFEIHKALRALGFNEYAVDGITLARPIAYVPLMRMFVQERVPGVSLEHLIGSNDWPDYIRASAHAIAKLHALKIEPTTRYALADELENLRKWTDELIERKPEFARDFEQLCDRLLSWGEGLPSVEYAPAHRDWYYSQILFSHGRTVLIDLDMLALADPAIDIGNFLAHLYFLGVQHGMTRQMVDEARVTYLGEYMLCTRKEDEFRDRVAFYEAATLFRLMQVALQRPQYAMHFDALRELTKSGVQEFERSRV